MDTRACRQHRKVKRTTTSFSGFNRAEIVRWRSPNYLCGFKEDLEARYVRSNDRDRKLVHTERTCKRTLFLLVLKILLPFRGSTVESGFSYQTDSNGNPIVDMKRLNLTDTSPDAMRQIHLLLSINFSTCLRSSSCTSHHHG